MPSHQQRDQAYSTASRPEPARHSSLQVNQITNSMPSNYQSINQSIYLTQKQQNDNEQEQSLRVNWTQREVSLHWRVPKKSLPWDAILLWQFSNTHRSPFPAGKVGMPRRPCQGPLPAPCPHTQTVQHSTMTYQQPSTVHVRFHILSTTKYRQIIRRVHRMKNKIDSVSTLCSKKVTPK